jgi:hypothetical protein
MLGPRAQHNLRARAGELEHVDLAPLVEPPTEGVDHLLSLNAKSCEPEGPQDLTARL